MNVSSYYNIQFDTPEWISVQGMYFTSHHPNHPVSPLPKDMYHNIGNYREGTFQEDCVSFDEAWASEQ
jgi:hypothetical protein